MMADAADMLVICAVAGRRADARFGRQIARRRGLLHNRRAVVQALPKAALLLAKVTLAAQVDGLLEARALSYIGLARKAGAIVMVLPNPCGFAKRAGRDFARCQ